MLALVDADFLVYRCGFAVESRQPDKTIVAEPVENALNLAKRCINGFLETVGCVNNYELYLSGASSAEFRKKVSETYKANRINVRKPIHYHELRNYLTFRFKAITVDAAEADDMLGVRQNELNPVWDKNNIKSVIIGQDKDLNNIPGLHLNPIKNDLYWVTEEEALCNFYTQILVGDRADNVQGLHGVGPKTAASLLNPKMSESEMYRIVLDMYIKHYTDVDLAEKKLKIAARLLWISQKKLGEIWDETSPGGIWQP
jgi:5'-3' exonuclease